MTAAGTFPLWRVTLRHDGGRVRIVTAARSAERAAQLVREAEGAPRTAVLAVELHEAEAEGGGAEG